MRRLFRASGVEVAELSELVTGWGIHTPKFCFALLCPRLEQLGIGDQNARYAL